MAATNILIVLALETITFMLIYNIACSIYNNYCSEAF